MAKIHFGGGTMIETSGNAHGLIELLAQVAAGDQRAHDQGRPLPLGYAALQSDHGPVYVNAAQVAYVRD